MNDFLVRRPQVIAPLLNFITIGVLLLWLGKKPLIYKEGLFANPSLACLRFYWSWIGTWIIWFIFYGYFLIEELLLAKWLRFDEPGIWYALQNSLNNLQSGFMFLCYLSMTWPIGAAVDETEFQPTGIIIPLFSAVVLMASIECLAAGFTPHFYPEYEYYFELFSAFAGGIVIALLASRLGAMFIGRVTFAIAVLFIYALVQMGYGAFREHPIIKEGALMIAIPLKIWIFIFVRWIMTRGRLLFYFKESIDLQKRIESDWKKFENDITSQSNTHNTSPQVKF